MPTLLMDIGTFLAVNGVVTADGVDLFRDYTPDMPDDIVAIHEYPGDAGTPFDSMVHRSVQVSVRGKDADTVRAKALSIYNLLDTQDRLVHFTEARWGQVYLRQPPYKIKVDSSNRVTYAFNAGITTTRD